jgi:hypothetical protein
MTYPITAFSILLVQTQIYHAMQRAQVVIYRRPLPWSLAHIQAAAPGLPCVDCCLTDTALSGHIVYNSPSCNLFLRSYDLY